MKKIIFLIAIIFCNNSSYSQTEQQKKIFNDFVAYEGVSILNDIAHPSCVCRKYNITSYSNQAYYIRLDYETILNNPVQKFSCEYKIQMDNTGHFISVSSYKCGSNDATCFFNCRLENFNKVTSASEKERIETYLNKKLENVHCEEYTAAKLFIRWYDLHYYEKY